METVKHVLKRLWKASVYVANLVSQLVRWWIGKINGSASTKVRAAWLFGGLLFACTVGTALLNLFVPIDKSPIEAKAISTTQSVVQTTAEVADPVQPTSTLDFVETVLPTDTSLPPTAELTDVPTEEATNTTTPRPSATSTSQPTATVMPQVQVSVASANLRSGPGANYDVLGTAVADDVLFVVANNQAGDWYNVVLANNSRAWIAASVVEMADAFDLGVARTIPAPPTAAATSPPLPTNTIAPLATSTLAPLPTNTLAPTQEPLPTAPPPSVPSLPGGVPGICTCTGPDLNCSAFSSHNEAQACHDYCQSQGYGDIYGLDGNDNDGLACESLP